MKTVPISKPTSTDWKFALLGELSSPQAPRLFTTAHMHHFITAHFRASASASTARAATQALLKAGALRQVSAGLFLNRRSLPSGELIEAAAYLRAGAVISLHSVLGECGFLNNPSAIVIAVVPTSAHQRPRLGELTTSQGDVFRFYGLAERFFPNNDKERWDMLQPGRACPMFRPEAALLQWLYLAQMKRSKLTGPPADVDVAQLDLALLEKLARHWGLQSHLVEWRASLQAVRQRVYQPVPAAQRQAAALAARERMLALSKDIPK